MRVPALKMQSTPKCLTHWAGTPSTQEPCDSVHKHISSTPLPGPVWVPGIMRINKEPGSYNSPRRPKYGQL